MKRSDIFHRCSYISESLTEADFKTLLIQHWRQVVHPSRSKLGRLSVCVTVASSVAAG